MSIYYIVVNRNKKEFINNHGLALGIKEHNFRFFDTPLIGYLMMGKFWEGDKHQYNPNENNPDYFFQGHWFGDQAELVDEYEDIYSIAEGYESDPIEDGRKWVNITLPLAKEWNREVSEWFDHDPDLVKKLLIPLR